MLLEEKNAIIFGAGAAHGGAVARTFAREDANVFLAGLTRDSLEKVAGNIEAGDGSAEVAVLDALDEKAVEEHAREAAAEADSIGHPLRRAADPAGRHGGGRLHPSHNHRHHQLHHRPDCRRRMIGWGSGLILALDSESAHGSSMMGSPGLADAATVTFIRNLAAELGPHGACGGIWIAGLPETLSQKMARGTRVVRQGHQDPGGISIKMSSPER